MRVEGRTLGFSLMTEGYTHDSHGAPIVGMTPYDYIAMRYVEILLLWPVNTPRPEEGMKPTRNSRRR